MTESPQNRNDLPSSSVPLAEGSMGGYGRPAGKDRREKERTPVSQQFGGVAQNSFAEALIKLLMILTQFVDPDRSGDAPLVNLLAKAFGFDTTDPEQKQYRALRQDVRENGVAEARKRGHVRNLDYAAASEAIRQGLSRLRNAPTMPAGEMTERQRKVVSVLADAASSAGVSRELMVGLWGYESNFGKQLLSPTGCRGDFQFTAVTMAETIQRDGAKIAERLRAQGLTQEANAVQTFHNVTKGMGKSQLVDYASSLEGRNRINHFRDDPAIATYAAAFYSRRVADQLDLDPNSPRDFGMIYAGYNIGAGNAAKIMRGQTAMGWEVDANAGIARRGSAAEQRVSYNQAIAGRIDSRAGQSFLAAAEGRAAPTANVVAAAADRNDRHPQPAPRV